MRSAVPPWLRRVPPPGGPRTVWGMTARKRTSTRSEATKRERPLALEPLPPEPAFPDTGCPFDDSAREAAVRWAVWRELSWIHQLSASGAYQAGAATRLEQRARELHQVLHGALTFTDLW